MARKIKNNDIITDHESGVDHRKMIYRPKPGADLLTEDSRLWVCPHCGFAGEADDYDCLLMDEDCVFCIQCCWEIRL